MIFGILVFFILLILASCQDYENFNSNVHGNNKLIGLRRRDSIPLHDINKHWNTEDDYNFRRTRRIRGLPPRNYEVSFFCL